MAAIVQGATVGLKYQVLTGAINFTTDTFKIALYTDAADLSPNMTTTTYSTTNEVVGTGYIAGGNTLVVVGPSYSVDDTTAYVNFGTTSWAASTFTARGATIYQSVSLEIIAVLDFGSNKTVNNETLTIEFPDNTATGALIRFE